MAVHRARYKNIKRRCDYCREIKKRWRLVQGMNYPNVRRLPNGCQVCNTCLIDPRRVPTIYVRMG